MERSCKKQRFTVLLFVTLARARMLLFCADAIKTYVNVWTVDAPAAPPAANG